MVSSLNAYGHIVTFVAVIFLYVFAFVHHCSFIGTSNF